MRRISIILLALSGLWACSEDDAGGEAPDAAPVEDSGTQPTEDSGVAEDGSAPVEDAAGPIEDGSTPIVDAAAPVEDGSTPVEDGSTPVDDAATPVEDGSTPVEDGSTPVEDAAPPIEDAAPPQPAERCAPLPPADGPTIEVRPEQADQLRQIVLDAPSGTTILLHDGEYRMDGGDDAHRLSFYTDDVTLRGLSGDAAAVVLDAGYVTGETISIAANDVTIADVTLRRAYYHPIHVTGGDGRDITGTLIYNVRVIDPGEQAIKINPSGGGTYADFGEVACSHLELTDEGRPHIRNNCYTGGVDGHRARGWIIRDNHIEGFWCAQGLSEHGIHFWTASRDTLSERNTIVNCARGIGYGMGASGAERVYEDDPYPEIGYIGHYDGIIRNNFIFADIGDRFDSGINLDQARGTQIVHNTVAATQQPFNCIEWRFDNAMVTLRNNLLSHNLRDRGGVAHLEGNIEDAGLGMFVDGANGDLHLVEGAAAIGAGVALPEGLCPDDIDGDPREGALDVGADQR